MIALIDYGAGNLHSVKKAVEFNGGEVRLVQTGEDLLKAEKAILPGVGAFGDGMKGLQKGELVPAIKEYAASGRPLLGICLGMQLLLDESEEMGLRQGLGLVPGKVRQFTQPGIKVPQIGWNQIFVQKESPLLTGLEDGNYVYFNHGYYCILDDTQSTIATTEYGVSYTSMLQQGNIYGAQFHPEKSQDVGMLILRNFVKRVA
jgi:glutamine amidotransferase